MITSTKLVFKGSKIFPGSINRVVKGSYPKSVFPTYNPLKK